MIDAKTLRALQDIYRRLRSIRETPVAATRSTAEEMSLWYTGKIDEIAGILHTAIIAEQTTKKFFEDPE